MKKYINIVISMVSVFLLTLLSGCAEKETALSDMKVDKYVKVGNYMGLSATKQTVDISDDIVDTYIDYDMQQAVVELTAVDRPAMLGDTVNIDYEGKKDGVAFQGGTAQGYDLRLGSHSFIDGFEDGLVGVEPGETVDLNLTFPENYQAEELAGAAVVFTVTVNEVKAGPSIEEFASSKGFDSVEAYREDVKANLKTIQQFSADSNTKDELFVQIQNNSEYKTLPEWFVNKYYYILIKRWTDTASQYGMTLADFAQNYFGKSIEGFESEIKASAEDAAKRALTCEVIFRKEGMALEQADYDAYLKSMGYNSISEIPNITQDDLRDDVMVDKVLTFVMNNATLTEVNQ